jgi:hypothetical protein
MGEQKRPAIGGLTGAIQLLSFPTNQHDYHADEAANGQQTGQKHGNDYDKPHFLTLPRIRMAQCQPSYRDSLIPRGTAAGRTIDDTLVTSAYVSAVAARFVPIRDHRIHGDLLGARSRLFISR